MASTIIVAAVDTVGGSPNVTCTGSNDTATIQSALNTVGAGGTVLFLPGTYDIGSQLNRVAGVTLQGSGYTTHFRIPNAVNTTLVMLGDSNTASGAAGVTIESIRFDGNNTNNVSGGQRAVQPNVVTDTIRNCWFEHFGRVGTPSCIGINPRNCTSGLFAGNMFLDTVDGWNSGGICSGLTVIGNTVAVTSRDYAFNVPNCSSSLFIANTAIGSKLFPFQVNAASNNLFVNNVVVMSGAAVAAFNLLFGASANVFVGNRISGTNSNYTAGFGVTLEVGEDPGRGNLALGNTAILPDGSYDVTADQILVIGQGSDTLYATVQDVAGNYWHSTNNAFEAGTSGHWGQYAIALPETAGKYMANTPSALTVGAGYTVKCWLQAAGAPASTDTILNSASNLTWNGGAWSMQVPYFPRNTSIVSGDALGISTGDATTVSIDFRSRGRI